MGSINTIYRNNLAVSDATEELVRFIEAKGGRNVHDSRHQKQISKNGYPLAGGLVYEFPYKRGLMIQLNADLPSIYVKSIFPNGQHIFDVFPEARRFHKDGKVYNENKKGDSKKGYHAALDHEDWLAPSNSNPVVLLSLIEMNIAKQIVESICNGIASLRKSERPSTTFKKSVKELSPEELLKKLERQDAIGIKGEDFVIEYEKKRIEKLGAELSKIDEYIIDRRKINVSQGYDIESHYDGQSRFIEVKTTTVNAEADFFFSTNEFNVLKEKGEEAFIYRVVLSEDLETQNELKEIQNPFGEKEISDFKAIAFKASLKNFEN